MEKFLWYTPVAANNRNNRERFTKEFDEFASSMMFVFHISIGYCESVVLVLNPLRRHKTMMRPNICVGYSDACFSDLYLRGSPLPFILISARVIHSALYEMGKWPRYGRSQCEIAEYIIPRDNQFMVRMKDRLDWLIRCLTMGNGHYIRFSVVSTSIGNDLNFIFN